MRKFAWSVFIVVLMFTGAGCIPEKHDTSRCSCGYGTSRGGPRHMGERSCRGYDKEPCSMQCAKNDGWTCPCLKSCPCWGKAHPE